MAPRPISRANKRLLERLESVQDNISDPAKFYDRLGSQLMNVLWLEAGKGGHLLDDQSLDREMFDELRHLIWRDEGMERSDKDGAERKKSLLEQRGRHFYICRDGDKLVEVIESMEVVEAEKRELRNAVVAIQRMLMVRNGADISDHKVPRF